MRSSHRLALTLTAALAACATSPPPPPPPPVPVAPVTAAAEAQPTADDILEAHVTATGGRAAHEAITTSHGRGSLILEPVGIGGVFETFDAPGGRSLLRTNLAGVGTEEHGTDGTLAWELSSVAGARLLDGAERERALRDARTDSELDWRTLFPTRELVGATELDRQPVWQLRLTDVDGEVETRYYHRDSHLLVGVDRTVHRQGGDEVVRTRIVDYRWFGPVQAAWFIEQERPQVTLQMHLIELEWNPTLPPDTFAVPPAVAALVK